MCGGPSGVGDQRPERVDRISQPGRDVEPECHEGSDQQGQGVAGALGGPVVAPQPPSAALGRCWSAGRGLVGPAGRREWCRQLRHTGEWPQSG